jgi:hypothetical protein
MHKIVIVNKLQKLKVIGYASGLAFLGRVSVLLVRTLVRGFGSFRQVYSSFTQLTLGLGHQLVCPVGESGRICSSPTRINPD